MKHNAQLFSDFLVIGGGIAGVQWFQVKGRFAVFDQADMRVPYLGDIAAFGVGA